MSMSTKCITGYEWPENLASSKLPLDSLNVILDQTELSNVVSNFSINEPLIVTLVSVEYLKVCQLWLKAAHKIEIGQYLIIATDENSAEKLSFCREPFCKAFIISREIDSTYRSPTGFTAKGLGITALKFPVVRSLLEYGFSVILIDIDALLIQTPYPYLTSEFDVAFQRVKYFPKAIAEFWGFCACSGFVWFKNSDQTLKLINRIISHQKTVTSDQIALNLALWHSDLRFTEDSEYEKIFSLYPEQISLDELFVRSSKMTIEAVTESPKLRIRALPPSLFWRNDIIDFDPNTVVLLHPNSPKTEAGKLGVYERIGLNKHFL